MKVKNTISSTRRTPSNKNLNFECLEDYVKCEYYHPNQPEESRCNTDSTIGYCVQEYFEIYDTSSEGIKEHGDTK